MPRRGVRKVTNGEVYQANEPMVALLQIPWPVKVSYALVKLAKKLSDQFAVIEETRSGLVRKHGDVDDETDSVMVKDTSSKYVAFLSEYGELMAQETELVIQVVKLPSEVDGKSILVEPHILLALEKFVKAE